MIPENYQYEWTPKSDSTLQEFLAKVRIKRLWLDALHGASTAQTAC